MEVVSDSQITRWFDMTSRSGLRTPCNPEGQQTGGDDWALVSLWRKRADYERAETWTREKLAAFGS